MKKLTFLFTSYDDLWMFKDQSKAINVKVNPRNNLISGLFEKQDIEMALDVFHAKMSMGSTVSFSS
jgi:pentatricopeptide repeat protein